MMVDFECPTLNAMKKDLTDKDIWSSSENWAFENSYYKHVNIPAHFLKQWF